MSDEQRVREALERLICAYDRPCGYCRPRAAHAAPSVLAAIRAAAREGYGQAEEHHDGFRAVSGWPPLNEATALDAALASLVRGDR